ncbi:hypothetical protein [Microvirga puerhi]|uniref:Uncharacterized protein n=1 Tax=Microvirga puerhi TaxID=2876078 RepID=A0ABS7VS84_9HYPH|nr:hypothetical protein [Microvirga puerhi]MBZ6078395.1 hypothetical protein [Microvirga puerhi]
MALAPSPEGLLIGAKQLFGFRRVLSVPGYPINPEHLTRYALLDLGDLSINLIEVFALFPNLGHSATDCVPDCGRRP